MLLSRSAAITGVLRNAHVAGTVSCISRNVKTTLQLTNVNTLSPKTHRLIPNTLSKAHQRWQATSQHFPSRRYVSPSILMASFPGVLTLNTPVRLFRLQREVMSCSHNSSFPSSLAFSQHALFLQHRPTLQQVNKLRPSGGSHHELLQTTHRRLLPLIQPQLRNEHIFLKQIT